MIRNVTQFFTAQESFLQHPLCGAVMLEISRERKEVERQGLQSILEIAVG